MFKVKDFLIDYFTLGFCDAGSTTSGTLRVTWWYVLAHRVIIFLFGYKVRSLNVYFLQFWFYSFLP